MKINLDDPKLTAYALDELSGDEKSEMEKAISESPEAQAHIDELREFSLQLKSEYEAERDRRRKFITRTSFRSRSRTGRGHFRDGWRWLRRLHFSR